MLQVDHNIVSMRVCDVRAKNKSNHEIATPLPFGNYLHINMIANCAFTVHNVWIVDFRCLL